jgi:hypothetical protein
MKVVLLVLAAIGATTIGEQVGKGLSWLIAGAVWKLREWNQRRINRQMSRLWRKSALPNKEKGALR